MSVGTKLIQAAAGNAGGGPGEALYYPTSSGTDQTATWVVPDGVESVSVVVVGPGASGNDGLARGSGGGGALAYGNNISVTPGESISIRAGASAGGNNQAGNSSYFKGTGYLEASGGVTRQPSGTGGTASGSLATNTQTGGAGGVGGAGDSSGGDGGGGGGAAGYSGDGGRGGDNNYNGTTSASSGSGGGGGGGQGKLNSGGGFGNGGAGGGVGVFGEGTSGGTSGSAGGGQAGNAGSGGSSTDLSTTPTDKLYGGGGGGTYSGIRGGDGAVRIVWPGDERSFPTTSVGRADSEIVYINGVLQ